jgi:hypothetical protein
MPATNSLHLTKEKAQLIKAKALASKVSNEKPSWDSFLEDAPYKINSAAAALADFTRFYYEDYGYNGSRSVGDVLADFDALFPDFTNTSGTEPEAPNKKYIQVSWA